MKKKIRLNRKGKLLIAGIILIVIILCCSIVFHVMTSAVSSSKKDITFVVEQGSTYTTIAPALKKQNLIRSELFYKLYLKLNNPGDLKEGTYLLNESMNLKEITSLLSKDSHYNPDLINVTFKEGLNIRGIARVIASNTSITYEEVLALSTDRAYIKSLQTKYWFITDEMLSETIFYPLDGYLFPNTYQINKKKTTLKELFEMMLDETEHVLTPMKSDIKASSLTVHQIMTLASIVESEGTHASDRAKIASVFFNRLNQNMALEADATTYYGLKLDLHERDLYQAELDQCNNYNTRCTTMKSLPVGPISNPGKVSIESAIKPDTNSYIFYVADNKGNTYFTKTYAEHVNKINQLKQQGLWDRW